MKRLTFSFPLLALLGAGCGGGGLLSTVPPPVEFAGQRTGGLVELPAAGTYTGTLLVERATLRYNGTTQAWQVVSATTVSPSTSATAVVGTDANIVLRRTGETANLFAGTLKVTPGTVGAAAQTTATLTAFDGTVARYPYYLKGTPRTLSLVLHTKADYASSVLVTFDRYTFDVTAP